MTEPDDAWLDGFVAAIAILFAVVGILGLAVLIGRILP